MTRCEEIYCAMLSFHCVQGAYHDQVQMSSATTQKFTKIMWSVFAHIKVAFGKFEKPHLCHFFGSVFCRFIQHSFLHQMLLTNRPNVLAIFKLGDLPASRGAKNTAQRRPPTARLLYILTRRVSANFVDISSIFCDVLQNVRCKQWTKNAHLFTCYNFANVQQCVKLLSSKSTQ